MTHLIAILIGAVLGLIIIAIYLSVQLSRLKEKQDIIGKGLVNTISECNSNVNQISMAMLEIHKWSRSVANNETELITITKKLQKLEEHLGIEYKEFERYGEYVKKADDINSISQ